VLAAWLNVAGTKDGSRPDVVPMSPPASCVKWAGYWSRRWSFWVVPPAVACRTLGFSTKGYEEWLTAPVSRVMNAALDFHAEHLGDGFSVHRAGAA
jgi:hypothetical protein